VLPTTIWYKNAASFEEVAEAMGELITEGKLRGWGMCNDNAYGLTASCYAARSVVGFRD
jgi:aryl-alcohol dehydrogenase-like predicted oxidoreductase